MAKVYIYDKLSDTLQEAKMGGGLADTSELELAIQRAQQTADGAASAASAAQNTANTAATSSAVKAAYDKAVSAANDTSLVPGDSYTTLSTSGYSTDTNNSALHYKNFTASSHGYYYIQAVNGARITNNANGMTQNSLTANWDSTTVLDGEVFVWMPVAAGQSVTIWWNRIQTPTLRFVAAKSV